MGDIEPLKRYLEQNPEEEESSVSDISPTSSYDMVKDFHRKFDLLTDGDVLTSPSRLGADPHQELLLFRIGFMLEELSEYCLAVAAQDREKALDALIDLDYVLKGTAVLHRFDRYDEAFGRVHAANMLKEKALSDGSNSTRGSKFDIVKPPGWKPASLKDLL